MTQTSSTMSRQEEQNSVLQTQVGDNGNGGRIIPTIAITGPDDNNEPRAAVLAAEALLIRHRIALLLTLPMQCNVITTPRTSLREQHASCHPRHFRRRRCSMSDQDIMEQMRKSSSAKRYQPETIASNGTQQPIRVVRARATVPPSNHLLLGLDDSKIRQVVSVKRLSTQNRKRMRHDE